MKKFKFALLTFMTALISLGFTACSDDDDLKNVSVTGVTITPTTLTLKAGTTGTLTATVVPENATVTTVAWSSSDTNIATIENGIVTAISEGSTTIKVKTDDGGFADTDGGTDAGGGHKGGFFIMLQNVVGNALLRFGKLGKPRPDLLE